MMWFRVEHTRVSTGHLYTLEYKTIEDGQVKENIAKVKGQADAKRQAELLCSSRLTDVVVYGEDSAGRYKFGVASMGDDAGASDNPEIQDLYKKSLEESLQIRDRLLMGFDENMIRHMATFFTSMSSFAKQFQQAVKPRSTSISYQMLQKAVVSTKDFNYTSIEAHGANIAMVCDALRKAKNFMPVDGINSLGSSKTLSFNLEAKAQPVLVDFEGDLKAMPITPVFIGKPSTCQNQVLVIIESSGRGYNERGIPGSIAIVYTTEDAGNVAIWLQKLLLNNDPFKNQIILLGGGAIRTVKLAEETDWLDVILPRNLTEEMDLIEKSIRDFDKLKAKSLRIKHGLLLSGPPGCGKTTAVRALANATKGKCTFIFVESIPEVRHLYSFAAKLAPAVIILEDLDMMTTNRDDEYGRGNQNRTDITGELLEVLSSSTELADIITIATTNHPEKIDQALAQRSGRFDAHIRLPIPSQDQKELILNIHMRRYDVPEELKSEIRKLAQPLLEAQIVGAHIEGFVRMGVKRAAVHSGPPTVRDFQPGIAAVLSVSNKPLK